MAALRPGALGKGSSGTTTMSCPKRRHVLMEMPPSPLLLRSTFRRCIPLEMRDSCPDSISASLDQWNAYHPSVAIALPAMDLQRPEQCPNREHSSVLYIMPLNVVRDAAC